MESLAFAGAAFEHFEVLAGCLVSGDYGATAFEASVVKVEVGVDEVANVLEEEGGPLLAVFIDEDSELVVAAFRDQSCTWHGGFLADLVAADIGETDGVEDGNVIDNPPDLGLPVDGLKDAAGCGGGDDVVGNALDFHFRTRKEGVGAGDFENDGRFHGLEN